MVIKYNNNTMLMTVTGVYRELTGRYAVGANGYRVDGPNGYHTI